MEKLLSDDIWPTLKKLSQSAKRVQAAIAYFSSAEHLKLKQGDMLIVNASEEAIRTRQTSAKVLWKLRKDVEIFNLPNLHAKLVLIDNSALIGSANASASSVHRLYEAAILTSSPQIVSQARSYLYQLTQQAERLTEQRLKHLLKIKLAPVQFGPILKRCKVHAPGKNTWIVSAEDIPDDAFPNERTFVEIGAKHVLKKHQAKDPNWLRWCGSTNFRSNAENGDQIIVIRISKGKKRPYQVTPPSAILYKQPQYKWTRFYYDEDLSAPLRTLLWQEFQQLLKQASVGRSIRPKSVCRLTSRDAGELERLWPRDL